MYVDGSSSDFLFEGGSDPDIIFNVGAENRYIGIGIGTTSPDTLLTIANDNWISAKDSAGTSYVNMFKVNASDEIDIGATLNIGPMELEEDSGATTLVNLPVSSTPSDGDVESYGLSIDSNPVLTIYGLADGSGGSDTHRVGIGTATPQDDLHVQGNATITGLGSCTTGVLRTDSSSRLVCGGATEADDDWRWVSGSTVGDPIYHTGNVGIGTDDPNAKLDIMDTGDTLLKVETSQTSKFGGNIVPWTTGSVGTSASKWTDMYMTGALYDGGTTYYINPDGASNLAGALDIGGDFTPSSITMSGTIDTTGTVDAGEFTEDGSTTLSNNISGDAATVDAHSITATTDNIIVRHDGVNLEDSGILDSSDAMAITIDSDEKVGIGTATPAYKLDVNGHINARGVGSKYYINQTVGADISCGSSFVLGEPTVAGGIVTAGTCKDISDIGGVAGVGNGTANYITKWSDANTVTKTTTPIFELDSKIGIGTTSPGTYKLNIWGDLSSDQGNLYTESGQITAKSFYDIDDVTYYLDPSRTDDYGLKIADSIHVIGTARDSHFEGNLQVDGTIYGNLSGYATTAGSADHATYANSALRATYLGDSFNVTADSQGNLQVDGTGDSYFMGDVAIGTTSAGYRLDVLSPDAIDSYIRVQRYDGDIQTGIMLSTGASTPLWTMYVDESSSDFLFEGGSDPDIAFNIGAENRYIGIGIGTSTPDTILTIANDNWISAKNNAGTSYVNMFKVNASDEIDVGGTLNIGPIDLVEDSGATTLINLPVSSTPSDGDVESYGFSIDSNPVLTIYGLADGAGGSDTHRVGIGTATPQDDLHVQGNATITGLGSCTTGVLRTDSSSRLVCSGATEADDDWRWVSGSTISDPIYHTGDVGVGTDSPSAPLHVYKDVAWGTTDVEIARFVRDTNDIEEGVSGYIGLHLLDDQQIIENEIARIQWEGRNADEQDGWLSFWTRDENILYQRMTITDSGNVGIGTTVPGAKLHLQNSGEVVQIMNTNSNAVNAGIYLTEGGSATPTQNGAFLVYSGADNNFYIKTAGGGAYTEKLTVERDSGNVAIGTTSAGYRLDVLSPDAIDSYMRVQRYDGDIQTGIMLSTGASTPLWTMYVDESSSDFLFEGGDDPDIAFNIGAENRYIGIGIGTSTPDTLLTIANDNWISAKDNAGTSYVNMFKVNASDEIDVGGTLNIGPIDLVEDSGATTLINLPVSSTPSDGDTESYGFSIDSNPVLTIYGLADGAGGSDTHRVGIGTISPSATLDVWGDAVFSGGVTMGNATLNGNIDMQGYDITGIDKIEVTTIDPIHEINGKEYATFVSFYAGGQKMETSGVVNLEIRNSDLEIGGSDYYYVIDFNNLEVASDLWLFWETLHQDLNKLTVILTPGFDGRVWYEKIQSTQVPKYPSTQLIIYSDQPGEVSYTLVAPRYDYKKWPNLIGKAD